MSSVSGPYLSRRIRPLEPAIQTEQVVPDGYVRYGSGGNIDVSVYALIINARCNRSTKKLPAGIV
jgi:hypothetical protein